MIDRLTEATNGILVYATMLLAALYLILTNFEKIGGVFYSIAEQRRVAAAQRMGADMISMKRQLVYLNSEVERLEAELDEERREATKAVDFYRAHLVAFATWAYDVRAAAAAGGITLPEPPKAD